MRQMPDEELASAEMPFWFLNVFFYLSGGMGVAINTIMLNNWGSPYQIRLTLEKSVNFYNRKSDFRLLVRYAIILLL